MATVDNNYIIRIR